MSVEDLDAGPGFAIVDLGNNNNNENAFQPGLGACRASLSSPGRLILSDLIGDLDAGPEFDGLDVEANFQT